MLKILLLLISLSSCAYFVSKIDTAMVNEKDYLQNIPETPTFCPLPEKVNFQLVSTNSSSQEIYQSFRQNNPQYDFLDHLVMWTLIQMSVRPDQSSPSSRFQILLQISKQNQYWDFFSEAPTEQYPVFYGLEWILKKYKKKRSLEYYASILDQQFPQKLKAGKNLENFLSANIEKVKSNPQLAAFFTRGTEVLREDERVPVLNFKNVIRFYRQFEKKQKIIVNSSLTNFTTDSGQKGSCNYDFNLYDNSVFLIDSMIPASNLFGLATGNSSFLSSTSQKIGSILPIKDFPLFLGESKVRSSAVCLIDNEAGKIWTFSNQSRDPGQHLFHLIRYGIASSKSTYEVDKLIRHSRHLFLSDPVRLVIESRRSRSDQIENLLKLNLPIYNAEKLGNIWAFTQFDNHLRFIIDDRNTGSFLCK